MGAWNSPRLILAVKIRTSLGVVAAEFEADLSESARSCGSAVVENASKQAIMI